MAQRPLAGVSSLTVDTQVWNVQKSSWRPSVAKREIVKGQTAVEGFSEVPMEGTIDVTVRPQPGQDVTTLINATGSTVVLVQRNGTTVYGSQMVQTGDGKTDTAEGTLDLTFSGPLVTASVAV